MEKKPDFTGRTMLVVGGYIGIDNGPAPGMGDVALFLPPRQ